MREVNLKNGTKILFYNSAIVPGIDLEALEEAFNIMFVEFNIRIDSSITLADELSLARTLVMLYDGIEEQYKKPLTYDKKPFDILRKNIELLDYVIENYKTK